MSDDTKPIDVLDIIRRVAIFNGGLVADDLEKVEQALTAIFETGKTLSADLEHSIAIANFTADDTVPSNHPIRIALDAFDNALMLAGVTQP